MTPGATDIATPRTAPSSVPLRGTSAPLGEGGYFQLLTAQKARAFFSLNRRDSFRGISRWK